MMLSAPMSSSETLIPVGKMSNPSTTLPAKTGRIRCQSPLSHLANFPMIHSNDHTERRV